MFGRLGWAEILVIVVLVVILFGHAKVPGMMKSLADGINIFKKELKNTAPASDASHAPAASAGKGGAKKSAAKSPAKKGAKKPAQKTAKKTAVKK